MKQRRSLTNIGGAVESRGEPKYARILADALAVTGDEEEHRAHVHGFHTYPARMHPITASRLVSGLTDPGDTVLDPFCGSGTVLVEAMLAGRNAIGTDLNPLAVELARLKTRPRTDAEIARLVECARAAAAVADARRKGKSGASRRYGQEDVHTFAAHTLLELDGLRVGIAEQPEKLRRALLLVLSSILTKVSRKTGDTSEGAAPKRIAAGYPAKLFVKKTVELGQRMAEFRDALPEPRPTARVEIDDALAPTRVQRASANAIVSSPPYAATYDYLAHHATRLRWLELDAGSFARGEMGARRRYAKLSPADARRTWDKELTLFLQAARRSLVPRGLVVLLMADSAVGHVALRADEIVREIGERESFVPIARAWQVRPHFHGPTSGAFRDAPRAEHLLLLRRGWGS